MYACWNIRGINDAIKQEDVKRFFSKSNVQLFALIEHRISREEEESFKRRVWPNRCLVFNRDNDNRGRICVVFKPASIEVLGMTRSD